MASPGLEQGQSADFSALKLKNICGRQPELTHHFRGLERLGRFGLVFRIVRVFVDARFEAADTLAESLGQ